jgi:superfamily II DNA or RNA helicase
LTTAIQLRNWQKNALPLWSSSMRGIVAAVTGAGKTTFALLCISEFINRYPSGIVLIVVPTIPLLDQWYLTLIDELSVTPNEVGVLASGRKEWEGHKYIIAVINSARNIASMISSKAPTFLIVDECHRSGSEQNAKVLNGHFVSTLGLSATPERQYDDGFHRYIKPVLGDIIFEYDYNQAFLDGVIVPFRLINIKFKLTSSEQKEYNDLTRRIAILMSKSDENLQKQLEILLRRRARISWNSPLRVPIGAKIALQHRKERIIIFHESITQANEIYQILINRGVRATIYHTHLSPVLRQQNLRLYKSGYYSCIVCCRALDEGLNVPSTSIGIIASGTSSMRQRIQRLGRVLRQVPGKQDALIYTLYATDAEKNRLLIETEKLEGSTEVSWLGTRLQSNG